MTANSFSKDFDYHWAGIAAISGIAGIFSYIAVLAASHSDTYVVALAFLYAFGITVSSIALYRVLGGTTGSPLALFAAVANVIAAAQLLAMLMVQMSVYALVQPPEVDIQGVWWGLDVAWDLYLGAGTILFGLAMIKRWGFGAWLGVPGVLISVLFLIFNIATFPNPPDTAGLVDLGPVVGLWYLVVYVRLGIAALLLRGQLRGATAALSR